ncbi:MAG TPA: hypothetical protein VF551_06295, partial [Chthoniobacterales bacterium]
MATIAPERKEDRVVFTSGPKGYSVREIIDAAHFRGELEPHWRELLVRIEAEKKGQASDSELDDSALDEAAIEFRYKYDLITAEETERWLELRSLTLADFSAYFARSFWQKSLGGHIEPAPMAYGGSPLELRELLVVELVLTGELDRMATRLSWRVAAREATEE